jgi:hypothetical protein
MSLHPTMTNEELYFILNAIKEIIENHKDWENDYQYEITTNEFYHKSGKDLNVIVDNWFN